MNSFLLKLSMRSFFCLFIICTISISCSLPADAALKPRTDIQSNLSDIEYARAQYFRNIKAQLLQQGVTNSENTTCNIETGRDIVKMALDIFSFFDSLGEVTKLKNEAIDDYLQAGKLHFFAMKNLQREANLGTVQAAFVLTAMLAGVIDAEYPGFKCNPVLSGFISPPDTGSKAEYLQANVEKKFILNCLFAVSMDILASVDPKVISDVYYMTDFSWKGRGFIKAIKTIAKARYAALPISYFVTKATGIFNDLNAAKMASNTSSSLKTKLIALEFLDYYFVTYAGDFTSFKTDIGLTSETASIKDAFIKFANQKNEVGITFHDLYKDIDWRDFLLQDRYDTDGAVDYIRLVLAASGPLALKIDYSGGPATQMLGVADTTKFRFEPDPLVMLDYTLQSMTVNQALDGGGNKSDVLNGIGLIPPDISTHGYKPFHVDYSLINKSTSLPETHGLDFTATVFVPADAVASPSFLASTNSSTSGKDVNLNISLSWSGNSLSYTRQASSTNGAVSGTLSLTDDTITRIKIAYDTGTGSERKTDWYELKYGGNSGVAITVPALYPNALVAQSGVVGSYWIEYEIGHPLVRGHATGRFKTTFTYDDLTSNQTQFPYLEIQTSTMVHAGSLGDSLRLTPADKVRIYPRNDPSWPDFKALTGSITVWLLHKNGEMYSVPGTLLADGGVEFSTTANMPADSYFSVYMVSSNDNGVKDSAPIYQTSQVVEYPGSATTGGSGTGSSTTGVVTVPRTGQYRCYDSAGTEIPCAGTGQDGDIQAGKRWTQSPRFTDNGDQTMTDTVTGLVWPKDGGTPTFGTCTGGAMTWQGALNYVDCLNNSNYLNHNDWRLPNLNELESIVNRQQANNATWLNSHGFNITASRYWSSNTSGVVPYVAWGEYMEEGGTYGHNKSYNLYSWPVRGGDAGGDVQLPRTGQTSCYNTDGTLIDCATQGQTQDAAMGKGVSWSPASRFTDNHDGTVTDNLTGLIWLQDTNCTATAGGIAKTGGLTWGDALTWSKGLASGACGLSDGSTTGDWRIPNVAELESLMDLQRSYPALSTGHPFSNVLQSGGYYNYFWSSSSVTSYFFFTHALVVNVVYDGMVGQMHKDFSCKVWPVRGGHLDPLKTYPPAATFISENLPDGSYQVGTATKAWRFKSGTSAINGLKAVRVSMDNGLGITRTEIAIGNVAANTDFLVYLPINPVHDATSIKSSYWKLVDSNGEIITITNSKSGQFWLKIKTNRPPEFNQLQLDSVAGRTNEPTSLQIMASDPDGDSLSYSVVSGGGSIIDGSWYGNPAKLYQNTFTSPGVHPVVIQADDGHGEKIQKTIYAVITGDTSVKDFFSDMKYADATTQQFADQYKAIQYLALYGITIGRPDPNDPNGRVFEPNKFAYQAEALGMLMKAASLRTDLALDAELRLLDNLVKFDQATGTYYNFSWATPYVLKAEALGLIDSAEAFEPEKPATREWFASMMAKLLKLDPPMDLIGDLATYSFADQADFSSTFLYNDARSAAFFGFMGDLGSSQIFNPKDSMIRADVAVVVSKVLRRPTIDGIETSGLTEQAVFGKTLPTVVNGQNFAVTGLTNLVGHRMLPLGDGNIKEDDLYSPGEYVNVYVIASGLSTPVIGNKFAGLLAALPLSVPTTPPDINYTAERSLLVLLEATDTDGRNRVRNLYRMEYGVIFPDQDGDGVRDNADLWPTNPLYAVDANGNGIPDNADSLWGLTNRNGSDQIKISGQIMTLQNAVLSGQYAQMMNDASPPTVVSASPATGSQGLPLTQAVTITFSRELAISTITSATVMLTNTTTSSAVAGTISYSLGILTFIPSSALSYANDYQFRITTGIKDLAGHPLAADFLMTFRTEPQNFPPTGTISINNGALYTNTPAVTLAITSADPDGVPWMCISQAGTCPGWVPFNTTSTFTLTGSAGAKTISIWFSDGKNLANSNPAATASITYDNTAPTLALSTLADGTVTRENQVNVTGVARDNVGGSGVASVRVNGKPVEFNSINGIFSYPLPLMSASTPITVVATDQAGNSATVTQTVNRDQAAPLLTIETPTDYSASSTALLTVSGTVEAGATVSVSLNGAAPVPASVTGTSYTAQVTLISTTILNTIQVTAAGLSGKSSSVKRSVRYNSGRWNMDVTDPPQDTLTSSGTYLLKGRASNVVNAPLTITITRGTDTYTPTVTNGAFEQLVTFPSDGLHVFSVLGTDSLGNKLSVNRIFNKGDFEQPVISQFSMPSASSSFTVPLTFTASDNVNVTGWCQVYGTATVADSCVWSSTPITSRTFGSQGLKTITGFVKDAAGNISAPAVASTTITVADQPMMVSLTGTGSGTVTSSPAGISCISGSTTGCSATFTAGSTVSLLQTPKSDSYFGGWSGNCGGTGTCSNSMTAAKSVTASFNKAYKAKIGLIGYDSLAQAYAAASTVDTILALDAEMPDNGFAMGLNKIISFKGGYKADYSGKSGLTTVLKGALRISSGTLKVESLIIR